LVPKNGYEGTGARLDDHESRLETSPGSWPVMMIDSIDVKPSDRLQAQPPNFYWGKDLRFNVGRKL